MSEEALAEELAQIRDRLAALEDRVCYLEPDSGEEDRIAGGLTRMRERYRELKKEGA